MAVLTSLSEHTYNQEFHRLDRIVLFRIFTRVVDCSGFTRAADNRSRKNSREPARRRDYAYFLKSFLLLPLTQNDGGLPQGRTGHGRARY